ncbi:MAG: hypothetical protein H7Z12_18265 [Rhodospirillaceae bacterium]|nr:hypothetical protein [Rhodospirillales bacterium]
MIKVKGIARLLRGYDDVCVCLGIMLACTGALRAIYDLNGQAINFAIFILSIGILYGTFGAIAFHLACIRFRR